MNDEIINNLEIRKLSKEDDLEKVAELIYRSDNYIYPYLFENDLNTAKKVLKNMILSDTIYNYKNILIAISSGQIIAMIVLKTVPIKINADVMLDCFINAGVSVGTRFAKVFNEYFKLLEDELPDIYVANIAVDKMFRNLGVGRVLFSSILDDKYTYHLEVVKDNTLALSLYKKLGFEIQYEYPGFTSVPCYRMERKNKW